MAWSTGVTNVNLPEAEIKRHIAGKAGRVIVVADGSKVGVVSLAPVCAISDVDLLVTSASAPPEELERLTEHGLAVEIAARRP
jgi:DeoR family transcriptional regulator of aga operon